MMKILLVFIALVVAGHDDSLSGFYDPFGLGVGRIPLKTQKKLVQQDERNARERLNQLDRLSQDLAKTLYVREEAFHNAQEFSVKAKNSKLEAEKLFEDTQETFLKAQDFYTNSKESLKHAQAAFHESEESLQKAQESFEKAKYTLHRSQDSVVIVQEPLSKAQQSLEQAAQQYQRSLEDQQPVRKHLEKMQKQRELLQEIQKLQAKDERKHHLKKKVVTSGDEQLAQSLQQKEEETDLQAEDDFYKDTVHVSQIEKELQEEPSQVEPEDVEVKKVVTKKQRKPKAKAKRKGQAQPGRQTVNDDDVLDQALKLNQKKKLIDNIPDLQDYYENLRFKYMELFQKVDLLFKQFIRSGKVQKVRIQNEFKSSVSSIQAQESSVEIDQGMQISSEKLKFRLLVEKIFIDHIKICIDTFGQFIMDRKQLPLQIEQWAPKLNHVVNEGLIKLQQSLLPDLISVQMQDAKILQTGSLKQDTELNNIAIDFQTIVYKCFKHLAGLEYLELSMVEQLGIEIQRAGSMISTLGKATLFIQTYQVAVDTGSVETKKTTLSMSKQLLIGLDASFDEYSTDLRGIQEGLREIPSNGYGQSLYLLNIQFLRYVTEVSVIFCKQTKELMQKYSITNASIDELEFLIRSVVVKSLQYKDYLTSLDSQNEQEDAGLGLN